MRSRLPIFAAAVAACASVAVALGADEYRITAPDGWVQGQPQSQGVVAVWTAPDADGFRQNLNLVSEPFQGTLAAYVSENVGAMQRHGSAIVMGPQADVATCDTHPAHFLAWKATIGGRPLIFEQTLSVWFDRAYVLTYTRAQGQPAIDDARAALTTLCIRQS